MDRRALLAASGSLLLVSACAPSRPRARRPTLVIGKGGDLSTMDPAVTAMSNDFAPIGLAYERLLRFVVRDGLPTGALEGELARARRLDPDGRSWVFELEPGHRFDDGTEVTAQAVRFSFERCLKIGLGVAQALDGLLRVETPDRYIARFVLAAPSPIFPLIMALAPMSVINPDILRHEKDGDLARAWLSEHTAGSGAYRVTSWLRGQRVTLKTNPHAHVRPREFDRVVIKVVRDEASYRTQLRRGDIDIFEAVTPDAAVRLAALPEVRVLEKPTPLVVALVPNNRRKPLDDVRVRHAIALALDVRAIIDSVVLGKASLVHGVLPEGVPGQDPSIPVPARDLAAARRLLHEAGVAPGLRLTLSYVPSSTTSDTAALAIQSQLAEAGIRVVLEVLASSAIGKVRRGDFDLALGAWYADFPDPWPIMKFSFNSANVGEGLNISRYANPAVDRLLNRAEVTMDAGARVALYRKAQELIVADQPQVDLFALHGLLACRRDIEGLVYNFWQPGLYNAARMSRARAA
jgi:peptide/nickel transport system substrate-binding protein